MNFQWWMKSTIAIVLPHKKMYNVSCEAPSITDYQTKRFIMFALMKWGNCSKWWAWQLATTTFAPQLGEMDVWNGLKTCCPACLWWTNHLLVIEMARKQIYRHSNTLRLWLIEIFGLNNKQNTFARTTLMTPSTPTWNPYEFKGKYRCHEIFICQIGETLFSAMIFLTFDDVFFSLTNNINIQIWCSHCN